MKHFSLRNRYSKRTLLVLAILTPLVLVLLGGGVYAALGGVIRSQLSTDVELQKGLIGWWKLDGNTKDSTPYGNNGTLVGSPTVIADRKAKAGSAYTFNGTTQEMTMNTSSTISTDATISGWFYWDSTTTNTSLLRDNTCTAGWMLGYASGANINFRVGGTSFNTGVTVSSVQNRWALYTMTVSGGTVRYYIDGVQVYTSSGAASGASVLPWHASSNGNCGQYHKARADDIRIYNRAVSVSEARVLYRQYDTSLKLSGGSSGLVGWWRMNSDAKDSTPNANNGTATASLTTDRKDATNNAYTFGGTNATCVALPASSVLNTTVFTFAAWVRPTNTGTISTILGTTSGSNPQFRLEADRRIGIMKQGAVFMGVSSGTVPINQWSHVAVSYSSSGVYTFYINGQASGGGTSLQSFVFSNYRIGCKDSSENFTGAIDDVRIYNKVLTATAIATMSKSYDSQVNVNTNRGTSGSVALTSGLQGYWAMNGNSNDSTPNSNTASVSGATLTTDRKVQSNKAYNFTGAPQYLAVSPPSSALSFTDNFTISSWIYPTSYRTVGYFGLKNGIMARGPGTTFNYGLQVTDANTITFVKRTGSEALQYTNFINIPTLTNKWTLVTMTISGGSLKLYINGQLYGANSVGTLAPGSSDGLYLGTMVINNEAAFIGKLDDIRIYGRVLNTAEISALYYTYF